MFIPRALVKEALARKPEKGKRNLPPFDLFAKENKLPLNILEDVEFVGNVEVHRHEADLWLCLEGEAVFTVGGVSDAAPKKNKDGSFNDLELRGAVITGGDTHTLKEGDWLWIPAGQPHMHEAKSTARLAVIKVPAREIIPLEYYSSSTSG